MQTVVDEVADGVFRLSTYVQPADFTFNQYLVRADEPLLFHTGPAAMFPLISAALNRVVPVGSLRWVSFGHHESDESGSMNEWLRAATQAQIAVGEIGCMISMNDLAARPPRALKDGETLDLGGKRVRWLATPHVPHCWDAGVLFEETTGTLLCGDLFATVGQHPATSEADPVGPALAAEDLFHATALTATTARSIRDLAELRPRTLALMHGPAYRGDCASALHALADGYAERFASTL
ncbi:MBL fold metallo-hydrolase [Sinimarinibacterium flocculans]|uniref:MBL fold metallo-hydrolase n=1 Tax=Sinimarinibacterium flocculans TaxID=985250 RepID=UPI0035198ED0